MRTFFKNGSGFTPQMTGGIFYPIPELTHSIVLDKRSRLIITGMTGVEGPICPLGCGGSEGVFRVVINGAVSFGLNFAVADNSLTSETISNYMVDLVPGTYTVEFGIYHISTKSPMRAFGKQSSIMVIPLE